MDKNRSEFFGRFCYDDSLTYEQLLELEAPFINALEALMERAGAAHLDFTPTGDALLLHCAFEAHKLYMYRKIAQEIAALLPCGVTARLLCVCKDLQGLYCYWVQAGAWQEAELPLPEAAPDGLLVCPSARIAR